MDKDRNFSIIGPGVMGEALIIGLLTNKLIEPGNILASGPHQDRLTDLMDRYSIQTTLTNASAVQDADVVILCVKPQKLPQVRAMPNTPAQVGEAMTVWTQSQQTSESQHALAEQILGALGQSIYVEEEGYIDMATAVSGTGPAYVFLFLESMIDAGVHLGLPRRIAEEMVIQTLKGSIAYYTQNSSHPARLRNQVTSPGGTSATALYYLEKMGFRTAISRAIWAAFTRSKELGKGHMHQDPEKI